MNTISRVLHGWIARKRCNRALVVLVPGHHDITIHSPRGAPADEEKNQSINLINKSILPMLN